LAKSTQNLKNPNLEKKKMQKSLTLNLENINKPIDLQNMGQQVDFCPKCGTLLKIANRGEPSFNCPKCRFKRLLKQNEAPKKNVRFGHPSEIVVVGKNEEFSLRPLPTVRVFCPTCGNSESETWSVAVGAETSSTVTFFRCTKCGVTTRETG
jgi:transcription factor S